LTGAPASAAGASDAGDPPRKWGAFVDVGGWVGNQRDIGTSDFFMPLLQDDRTMLFADLRGQFDDRRNDEGNFGLGVRHMLDSGWNLGGYAYYDRRITASGATFGQMTAGIEALSLDWDVRANVYHPVGPSIRNFTQSSSSSSTSSSSS